MTPVEREIARQRAQLARIEHNGASEIVRSYQTVQARLKDNLAQLARQIDHAERAGVEVRPGWLFAQARYQRLMSDLEQHTLEFLQHATGHVTTTQRRMVDRVPEHTTRLTVVAAGPAPAHARNTLAARLGRLPRTALDKLIGYAGDGRPLGMLLHEIAPDAVQTVKDTLAFGVAAGRSPRVIAHDVARTARIPLGRALTISRTESLRAYRAGMSDSYEADSIVTSWTWVADLDNRTCPLCWGQNGTVWPIAATMDTHVNCRCSMAPNTPSWQDLGFDGIPDEQPTIEPGPDVFARLPASDQRKILGPAKHDLYQAGRLTLRDLVRPTTSPRWGNGIREATLAEVT